MKTFVRSAQARCALRQMTWPALISSMLLLVSHASTAADACDRPVLTLTEAAALLRIDDIDLARLAEEREIPVRRVGAVWRFNCDSLLSWLNGDWGKESGAGESVPSEPRIPLTGAPLARGEMADVTAAGTTQEDTRANPGADRSSAEDAVPEPIGDAPGERTAEDVLLRDQRVLLRPGQAVLDLSQFYSEANSQPLAAVEGGAALAAVEQESLVTALQGRIGLRNDAEFFVGTSYFNRDTAAFVGSENIARGGSSDVGSVGLGYRRTLKREGPGAPNIIGTISTQIPIGDTSPKLGASLAFVKSIDPAVLFTSVNYSHTFSREFADIALLEPDDQLDFAFGYALALNDTLALSMSVSSSFTGATRFDNAHFRQQDSYSLRFGLTSWLATGLYIEPSVSFNLGGPDDSLVFGITVPYTVGRRKANAD